MTTVVDPAGTPVAIFNKSGTAIIDMAVTMGPSEPLIPIPSLAGKTIVRVTISGPVGGGDGGLELPSDAEIGDVVEIANISTTYVWGVAYAPSGETINGDTAGQSIPASYMRITKISTTDWRRG